MKNPLRMGLIAIVVSAALLNATPADAQTPAVQPNPVAEAEPFKITVDFDGGTLQSYIEALQKAAGKMPVNVIAPAEARKVELPAISLRNVNVYTALSAITSAFELNSQHRFGVQPIGNPADATYAVEYRKDNRSSLQSGYGGPGRTAQGPVLSPFTQSQTKRLEVYSIRDLIDPPSDDGREGGDGPKVKFDDILSAIEGAMQLLDSEDKPRLLFHKETGLLMVGGTQYQTEVVSSLLSRIRDDLAQRGLHERDRRREDAAAERTIKMHRSEMRLTELEMTQARDRLARIEQMVQQGVESTDSLAKAKLDFERAAAKLERQQIELQAFEEGARTPTPSKGK